MTAQPENEWVAVAAVLRPHALRGAVILHCLTSTAEDFLRAPLKVLRVRRRGAVENTLTLTNRQPHGDKVLATFQEVPDRTAAEELSGAELVIPAEELWDLPENTWFHADLEGLSLVDAENGKTIGNLLRIQEGVAHDYLVFDHPQKPGKEVLLPFVDAFVPAVEADKGRILVRLPGGLLDL